MDRDRPNARATDSDRSRLRAERDDGTLLVVLAAVLVVVFLLFVASSVV